MDKLLTLPLEKRKKIIDAAMTCFAISGYKKTSINDIANTAKVSKALIFHYFGSKKALYLYLLELCGNIFLNEINEKFDSNITDFFDRIKHVTEIEISILKKYPAMPSFLKSAYFENDDEVKDDIKAILFNEELENLRNKIALGVDTSKFKDDIDPKMIMKIFTLLTDGYLSKLPANEIDLDVLCHEFYGYIDLFKKNFYKEEYTRFSQN
ncbi:transcriptional regulator [Thermoanaerobacterium thermosaccharolyticum]|uniref:TetR family transcriptional regulator n=1 Tax=Thermoanaerobacterium thermosaccharolyticum TaxID=1517 RepID=A0A231VHB0_THETR|nr:TetR/AcrR family transcriptional regulator [Thermoanaerobacterium thermosaccharolyticum]OXT07381.1 TetR family transcriptional regulator [Thermoanaerobacterium thermosaccharolyticum]PHO08195.1 transcriptional regulator [Thermoanaerobacterium thermosaccharolyticum]